SELFGVNLSDTLGGCGPAGKAAGDVSREGVMRGDNHGGCSLNLKRAGTIARPAIQVKKKVAGALLHRRLKDT
ncbi:MAG: hypothetical protein ACRD68_08820, partial [Pyrinomonadaceae bacterium]